MQYEKIDTGTMERHLWKNEKVTFYSSKLERLNGKTPNDCWEIELTLKNNGTMSIYRFENNATFEEAAKLIALLLELFDRN